MQGQENRKTMIYVLVAGMALLVAWEPWRPLPTNDAAPRDVGTKLFPDFKDPLSAKSLEITRFDEDTATLRPFKVAQVNGVWSIPSHNNYPADAREHMAQAATALLDVDILGVASSNPGDQELFGVIAPDPQKLKPGMVGVGTRVTLKDDKDKVLADLIVGKEVKDQPAIRHVRRADRDQIYRVAIKTDKLSTKFEDWIEKDLLKLNAFDVREVGLNDYSLEEGVTPTGGIGLRKHQRSRVKLAFDDTKSTWSVLEMTDADQSGAPVPVQLGDDEELDNTKLNALKTAIDDLQIVDVERKPKGLSQDLRASDEFVKDNEARASLITRGFYPVPVDDRVEMFSSEGEATCATKDGVKYFLRFGHLAGGEENKQPGEKEAKNPALNRFLFVMAQFDESQIPKPQLDPLPGEEPPADKVDDKAADDKTAEQADEKKTDEPQAEEKKPETKAPAPAKVPQKKTAAVDGQEEEPAAESKPAPPAAEKKQDDASAADPASPEEQKKLAIQKENKRKQDEYNDTVKKGQERVKELNDRFADWYFIISDDVYKKIHLGRADIVQKKGTTEAAEKGPGEVNPLEQLQQSLQPK